MFPIVNAKTSFRITRKTRFLEKAGFPDLSGKHFRNDGTLTRPRHEEGDTPEQTVLRS